MAALRLSLQATRERVKGLEEEVQALKGPREGDGPGMAPAGPGFGSGAPAMGAGRIGGLPGFNPDGWPMGRQGPGNAPGAGPAPGGPGFPPMGAVQPGRGEGSAPGKPPTSAPGFAGAVGAFLRGAETNAAAEVEAALKKIRERVAIELRVVPGARNGADVDEPLDAVRLQKRNEIVQRSVRVPDGENGDAQTLFSR